MTIYIETPRLIIRQLLASDAEGMFEMDSDPEVHRYVGRSLVSAIQQTRGVIDYIRQQYRDDGIGRWAMLLRENGDFVGWTGFKVMHEHIHGRTDFIDFGYRLSRKYWPWASLQKVPA